MKARNRKDGIEHIALTVDILWQIWKVRNDREFKDKERHPMEVIQKIINDWEGYSQIQHRPAQVSISETEATLRQEQRPVQEEN